MPARIPSTKKTRKGAKAAKTAVAAPKREPSPTNPLGAGRHEVVIDLEKVDRMLMAGCTGTSIAKALAVHPDTLYRRIREVYGVADFTAYAQQMRSVGDDNLRLAQYTAAMKGNIVMQIFLGKNRLGQADKVEQKNEETVVIEFGRPKAGDAPKTTASEEA